MTYSATAQADIDGQVTALKSQLAALGSEIDAMEGFVDGNQGTRAYIAGQAVMSILGDMVNKAGTLTMLVAADSGLHE
jgi:hypothetical protein